MMKKFAKFLLILLAVSLSVTGLMLAVSADDSAEALPENGIYVDENNNIIAGGTAKEAGMTYTALVELESGASVRINTTDGKNGLRFENTVNVTKLNELGLKVGTLILPTDLLGQDGSFDLELALDISSTMTDPSIVKTGDNAAFYASIVDLADQNLARSFSAISYIETADGTRYYTTYNAANNSRSMYEVAYKAVTEGTGENDAAAKPYVDSVLDLTVDLVQNNKHARYTTEFALSYDATDNLLTVSNIPDDLKTVIINGMIFTDGWTQTGTTATLKPYSIITLNANGHTYDGDTTIVRRPGEAVTLPTLTAPSGKTFYGWYTGVTSGLMLDDLPWGDATLYARSSVTIMDYDMETRKPALNTETISSFENGALLYCGNETDKGSHFTERKYVSDEWVTIEFDITKIEGKDPLNFFLRIRTKVTSTSTNPSAENLGIITLSNGKLTLVGNKTDSVTLSGTQHITLVLKNDNSKAGTGEKGLTLVLYIDSEKKIESSYTTKLIFQNQEADASLYQFQFYSGKDSTGPNKAVLLDNILIRDGAYIPE